MSYSGHKGTNANLKTFSLTLTVKPRQPRAWYDIYTLVTSYCVQQQLQIISILSCYWCSLQDLQYCIK